MPWLRSAARKGRRADAGGGPRGVSAMKIIIVGAGIGGLTAHLVCKRAGFEVEHYERQPQLGPAGAGIVLWPNGVKILLALGVGDRLGHIGHKLERVVTRTNQGEP